MKFTSRTVAGAAIMALAVAPLAACSSAKDEATPKKHADVQVIATTTPLASITSSITDCAGGTTTALMPVGADPHTFAPSSQQVTQMVKAKLVIANGLELEHHMEKVFETASKDGAKIYEVGADINPIKFEDHGYPEDEDEHKAEEHKEGEHAEEGHHEHTLDPHFWLDANRMATAAEKIGSKLAEATGDKAYTECAAKTAGELRQLNDEIAKKLASVPQDKRVLITDHEAFGYFGTEYKFDLAGVAIKGGSTEADANSENMAKLVETVKSKNVRVIFSNTATSPKLMESIAKEVGGEVKVVPLYVGSVGPKGSGAESYTDMMRKNAELIASNLK